MDFWRFMPIYYKIKIGWKIYGLQMACKESIDFECSLNIYLRKTGQELYKRCVLFPIVTQLFKFYTFVNFFNKGIIIIILMLLFFRCKLCNYLKKYFIH